MSAEEEMWCFTVRTMKIVQEEMRAAMEPKIVYSNDPLVAAQAAFAESQIHMNHVFALLFAGRKPL